MGFQRPALIGELTPRLIRVYLLVSVQTSGSAYWSNGIDTFRGHLTKHRDADLEQNFGFDNNWWGSIVGLQKFIDDYGESHGPGQPKTLPSSWLSAASGTPIAGWIIGCLVAGFVTRRIGRKITIVVICCIAMVGIILQCAIPSYWGIMCGRLINSISMGLEANCVPVYMSELAPAAIRGALVNMYQAWLMIGAVIATGTIYGTSQHLTGQWSYKTDPKSVSVMVIQIAIPIALLVGVYFIPESPRWLLSKGRREEALKALEFMRHGSATHDQVVAELDLLQQAIDEQEAMHQASSFVDCFKGSNGRRTLIAIGIQVLQQSQGNSFVTTYLVIFLEQIGVASPLLISCANACTSFAGTVLAFFLSDYIGRRPMLIGGAFFMMALMWIISGLASWLPGGISGSSAKGCVAALLIYSAFSTGCWGSVMWTVTAEVGTTSLRERTMSISTVAGFITSLLITYINPYVEESPGNLGSRVGFVYGSVSIVAMVFVYFLVPEMKGRSLEELDELFQSKVPAWRSSSFEATGIGATITQIDNMNSIGQGTQVLIATEIKGKLEKEGP
ncbi:hypothetical protein UA08_08358 [Talaromyces atroroseus]|uniref:Major facilitator superfamily (MFS) profile domain-containing protein n=1 Tax=Talaromyces atroroseus TaxID=1441469 RepID=A0A225A9D2_TALAT|nr:hypothetical protein UA08_08358 [Talaromyces atroroseus]OKL56640.1 hypothetical protein UA08_08358 [Talaromyces atroroseus]